MNIPSLNKIIIERLAKGKYKTGHDSFKLLKRMAYYDKYYRDINFFDLMASVLACLNEKF